MILRLSFLFALTGTVGSLFLGEVLGYPPCVLCWYQRIFLYPLVFVFGSALLADDGKYWRYSLPLTSAGLIIAVYHNLLYYGVIPERISPCQQGVSCITKQLELLGFITIPLMSFAAFLALGLLGYLAFQEDRKMK